MKKTTGILTVVLMVVLSLGYFIYRDDTVMKQVFKEFDTTVNIVSNPEQIKQNIETIQVLAQANDLIFVKQVSPPKDSPYAKQEIYFYVSGQGLGPSEKSSQDQPGLGQFDAEHLSTLLTRKKLQARPFAEINPEDFNGDYQVKGKADRVQDFVDQLNQKTSLAIQANIDPNFSQVSQYTVKQAFIYGLSVFVLAASLIFCFIMYNSTLSKEISVVNLLGYNKAEFSPHKSAFLLLGPSLLSLFLSTLLLYFFSQSKSLLRFILAVKDFYLFFTIIVGLLFGLECILLMWKVQKSKTLLWLKGMRTYHSKLFLFAKTASLTLVLYLLTLSVFGLANYLRMQPYLASWDKAQAYGNIACSWPTSYEENDQKFQSQILPNLNDLWDQLDDQGAILFESPNMTELNSQLREDQDYLNSLPFNGKYAYINQNYLDVSSLLDDKGQVLKDYEMKDKAWTIFVPESLDVTEEDRRAIRQDHFDQVLDKEAITEDYVFIQDKQEVFSFDSRQKISEGNLRDYVFIMVQGSELDPAFSIKLPSLVNASFHPYLTQPQQAYQSLKETIDQTKASPYILYVSNIFNDMTYRIEEYKIESFIYLFAFILALFILFSVLAIDRDNYFYSQGQRIEVLRLLGYPQVAIHKRKLVQNFLLYGLSIMALSVFLLASDYLASYGLYSPEGGWLNQFFPILNLLVTLCLYLSFLLEYRSWKKRESRMVEGLKEGT